MLIDRAVAKLDNTPVKKAWERITTQLGADEAQLAYLDSVAIPEVVELVYLPEIGNITPDLVPPPT